MLCLESKGTNENHRGKRQGLNLAEQKLPQPRPEAPTDWLGEARLKGEARGKGRRKVVVDKSRGGEVKVEKSGEKDAKRENKTQTSAR